MAKNHRTTLWMALVALLVSALVTIGCTGTSRDGTDDGREPGRGSSDSTDAGVTTNDDTGTVDGGAGGGGTGGASGTEAQRLVEIKCATCHSLDRVWGAKMSREGWASTVDRMKRNGLVLSEDEYAVIVNHLAATRGE